MLSIQPQRNYYHLKTDMSATLTEGALDLSQSKPTDTSSGSRHGSKASSPVPSLSSDTEYHHTVDHADRSESVSSDGHETDSSTGPAVNAICGPVPPSSLGSTDPEVLKAASTMPPNMRPFKMYPMEPTTHTTYPHMSSAAAAAAAMSTGLGISPLSPGATMGPLGMLDPSVGLTCSPIAQYIQQRKRRAERTTYETSEQKKLAKTVPEEQKDEHYWERRRKNNDAAKRSRDSRRMKEEEIALRAAFLEQENLKLRAQVAILKNETAKLHYMLYNRI